MTVLLKKDMINNCIKCGNQNIQILAKSGSKGCKYNFICKCGEKGPAKDTYDKAVNGWNQQNTSSKSI